MLFMSLYIAAGLLLSSIVSAEPASNTISFRFEKLKVPVHKGSVSELYKRQSGTVTTQITNEQLLYLINITVGTPPQPIGLQLDTGSSDIWFPSYNSDVCNEGAEYCSLGSFNYQQSSTFSQIDSYGAFQIAYVDGSEIQGIYMSDVLNIGSTQLTNATLALATHADRDLGIMGIGFQTGESSANRRTSPFTYPNVINLLKSQGHISSLSYSLWLDDLNDNTGTILFGGVDTTKYTGPLISLPIQNDFQTGRKTSFTVTWTNLTLTNSGPSETVVLDPGSPQPAILDSGTTLTYLPDAVANQIFNALGVITDPRIGQIAPCRLAANNLTFTYTFGGSGGASISIPISELLIPLITQDGTPYTGRRGGGDALCQFGIDAAGSNPILFGDTFLRSAYVVYDLENLQIGLAQLNTKASASGSGNVQVISASPAGIPDVTSTASAVTVDQTYTGNPLITVGVSGTGSGIGTERSTLATSGTGVISRSATLQLTASGTSAFSATARTSSASSSGGRGSSSTSGSGSTASGSAAGGASGSGSATGSASSASTTAGAVRRFAASEQCYALVFFGISIASFLMGFATLIL
ncbi:hypothetical protein H2198_008420 [Neophaeococcomyces mojaviensis]|uniref:Uncharacterized protein n=1 Tax=Neophaeococcomyces mojaviensis TaxID=3383035 RepID=A0ACC2ZXA1_9EURO|nr:hypothetical protein H2198_008420 [Knufia sp. JES_112]